MAGGAGHFGRVVGAAVARHHDLEPAGIDPFEERVEAPDDDGGLVVGRDEDRSDGGRH